MKGFAMLEVIVATAIAVLLAAATIKINLALNKEVTGLVTETNKLISLWNIAARDEVLRKCQ